MITAKNISSGFTFPCPSGQYHYFVVNNKGQKDYCDAHNYNSAASAPDICTCASW